jgi:hypothetical protein
MITPGFLNINDVVVNEEVVDTYFCCSLSECKGACCTLESEFGAPLKPDEIEEINKVLPLVKQYLAKHSVEEIEARGFYEKKEGELLVKSINNKACVFVYYEDSVAKCAIEKAYLNHKTNFKKPISCHLFPIRISNFGGDVIRYEKFADCKPALENGIKQDIKIYQFCKEALERYYGKNWNDLLIKRIINK